MCVSFFIQTSEIQTNVLCGSSSVLHCYLILLNVVYYMLVLIGGIIIDIRLFEYLSDNSLNFPVIHHINYPKGIHRYISTLEFWLFLDEMQKYIVKVTFYPFYLKG